MEAKHFFIQLLILSVAVAAGLYFLNQLPQLQAHASLSWISLVGFIGLSVLMYYAGKRGARSENKNDFTNVVLGFTIGKMFMAIMVIYAYLQLAKPEGKAFILPFFGIYLIFTAFETFFMMKLGKSKV
ncbi:hypothetical protein [Flavilitoribacter nigricans]|uniref:ATP synthase subunit I n=1 Tax=Flavilitoribacter nigricans (strain ATCC 23147 / DSM 23189 / NBRC 102662 / NCIMB 1420 / SS-2) TaxID=1122177 RepID=A0A2D0NF41_FLAN2|nr:hypothetical protein [Flavilitoribacter nigricans]PHN07087.1 hypothetical protein CRP01_07595 [Flavilitoribacter nigricans DSM 23189 = NBRC 102662]